MATDPRIVDVARWDATVEVADEEGWAIALNAEPRSLEVREGLRGVKPLTDKDRVEIRKNIDEKVLGGHLIRFRSSGVRLVDDGGRLGRRRAVDGRQRPAATRESRQ